MEKPSYKRQKASAITGATYPLILTWIKKPRKREQPGALVFCKVPAKSLVGGFHGEMRIGASYDTRRSSAGGDDEPYGPL